MKKTFLRIHKTFFSKLIHRLFSNVTRTRFTKPDKTTRQCAYVGVSYLQSEISNEIFNLVDMNNYWDSETLLLKKNEFSVTIGILSNVVSNGYDIFKKATFNVDSKSWNLEVRGTLINLNTLGLSCEFNKTLKAFKDILYIVKQIKLCKGLELCDKKTAPTDIVVESLTFNDSESKVKSFRCNTCIGVIGWTQTGDACIKCRKRLNTFKNTNSIDVDIVTDTDLSKVLDSLFPGASPEMKNFLESQHNALHASGPRRRRWDKTIIKTCLSLWSRSPRSYQDLKDSNF